MPVKSIQLSRAQAVQIGIRNGQSLTAGSVINAPLGLMIGIAAADAVFAYCLIGAVPTNVDDFIIRCSCSTADDANWFSSTCYFCRDLGFLRRCLTLLCTKHTGAYTHTSPEGILNVIIYQLSLLLGRTVQW